MRNTSKNIVRFAAAMALLVTTTISRAEQSLEQAANDPTASLMNVAISDWYTADYHELNGENANSVVVRSAIPFTWGEQSHIFRVTLPYTTDNLADSEGLQDSVVFDLLTFGQSWGRWGIGAVGLIPTGGEKRGEENWGLGPAIGFVTSEAGRLLGVFNQNIFSVEAENDRDEVNVSIIQPIINFSLGNGFSVGGSDMSFTYDWEGNRWASLPLGVKLSKLFRLGGVPLQVSGEYEYNFEDSRVAPETIYRLTAKVLFPVPG